MKVLVACEESQRVCQAFRDKGHEAYSCDILPTSGDHPEWHIKEDVLNVMRIGWRYGTTNRDWDMMIGFPPCTYLCNSSVRWLKEDPSRWKKMENARQFFAALWSADIKRICIENPIPHLYGIAKTYTQIIQPWQFGHGETKATCLWLKNLPKLVPTNIVEGREARVHKMSPGPNRARDRARTYPGIAAAMAEQWGNLQ